MSPPPSQVSVTPGSVLGSYRLVRRLGAGGMGEVFEAVHERLGKRAAIKVLLPEFSARPDAASRFFNEARAACIIQHPGIINVFEHGRGEDGAVYIIMEFVEGESLGQRLERWGRLDPITAISLGHQIATTLSAVHDKGIIHRDLKPDNVMLTADGLAGPGERCKIVDFGIAKLAESYAGPEGVVRTRTNEIVGTPAYMSPEQCRGLGGVDAKSDVYSLGVMLFQMLAGERPFHSAGIGDLMAMHILLPPPLLQSLEPTLNKGLAELVARMLAKDPETRPDMGEVAEELRRLQGSLFDGFFAGPRRRQREWLAGGFTALVLVGLGFLYLQQRPTAMGPRQILVHNGLPAPAPIPALPASQPMAAPVRLAEGTVPPAGSPSTQVETSKVAGPVRHPRPPPRPTSAKASALAEPGKAPAPDLIAPPDPAPDHGTLIEETYAEYEKAAATEAMKGVNRAYVDSDYEKVIELARPLRAGPLGDQAWRFTGGAACHLDNVELANESFPHLDRAGKHYVVYVCERSGITLVGGKFRAGP